MEERLLTYYCIYLKDMVDSKFEVRIEIEIETHDGVNGLSK